MTLAPYVLAPEAASLLPRFNSAVPASVSLLHHLPSHLDSIIPNSAHHTVQSGVNSVLNTGPTNVHLKYVNMSRLRPFL